MAPLKAEVEQIQALAHSFPKKLSEPASHLWMIARMHEAGTLGAFEASRAIRNIIAKTNRLVDDYCAELNQIAESWEIDFQFEAPATHREFEAAAEKALAEVAA